MSEGCEYAFKLRYVSRPSDSYYYTNWTNGSTITVVATTQQDAINMAVAALGDAGWGHYWTFRVLEIVDMRARAAETRSDRHTEPEGER